MPRAEITDGDRDDLAAFIERHWGSKMVMSRGRKFFPHEQEGFVERRNGDIVGVLTYHVDDEGMEILTLNATLEGQGIGSALMLSAIHKARELGCPNVFLTTTNDRLGAIGFYQRMGFRLVGINIGVVDAARKVKPQIPEVGERGIPIHDEVLMSLDVHPYIGEA